MKHKELTISINEREYLKYKLSNNEDTENYINADIEGKYAILIEFINNRDVIIKEEAALIEREEKMKNKIINHIEELAQIIDSVDNDYLLNFIQKEIEVLNKKIIDRKSPIDKLNKELKNKQMKSLSQRIEELQKIKENLMKEVKD